MVYKICNSPELAHSLKGSSWSNHKYIDKFLKNGKWRYVYKNNSNKDTSKDNQSEDNPLETTNEYYKVEKDANGQKRLVKYTEYTQNGSNWLSTQRKMKWGDEVTVFKTKGKIAQGAEVAINKGKDFINKLKNKGKNKK